MYVSISLYFSERVRILILRIKDDVRKLDRHACLPTMRQLELWIPVLVDRFDLWPVGSSGLGVN